MRVCPCHLAWAAAIALVACGDPAPPELTFVAVTFNTGTSPEQDHDAPPDDGYTEEDAAISDMYYGDGLAWVDAVDATEAFFADVAPDIVAFQEIFHADACADIPDEAHAKFYCERWSPGDPTVTQAVLGAGYQIACNLGKPDKCAAVKKSFGGFRGCTGDVCLDGLAGAEVAGCGSGSRIGRGVIDLADGSGAITVVAIHGTSGISPDDQACRVQQFEQVFVDLGTGDGAAANGAANVILGDLNTDPGRLDPGDDSATRFADFTGDDQPFHFVTDVGEDAVPTYSGLLNIDHVVSDVYEGGCRAVGITEGTDPVIDAVYFDHVPIVCTLEGKNPPPAGGG